MRDQAEYNVRAVERALYILGCFTDQNPERGVSEIAELVGLHKATTHRILTTLLNYGYIERAEDGQRYRLGLQLAELGFKVMHRMDVREIALPYMTQLSTELDEMVDLSVFDHGEVFYINILQSRRTLTIAASVGQRLPAYCTASGKLFLAHLPLRSLETLPPLRPHTSKTIISRELLLQELEKIRQQGYSVDDEELEQGIRAVAAPVYDREGGVVAAVSMPGPTSRMTLERIPELAAALVAATQKISHRLGQPNNG